MPTDPDPGPPPAPRHLVVCCDGTNNTLTGGQNDTHVLQLVELLALAPRADRRVFYDPGVGVAEKAPPTDALDWLRRQGERLSGLATGRGVFDNIAEAYGFLVRHWRGPQDRIYLFGFSRGAFTARAVAGMVNLFGLVRPEHENLVPSMVRLYFAGASRRASWTAWLWSLLQSNEDRRHADGARDDVARQIRQTMATAAGREAWVHWVGVWDTVESVGLLGKTNHAAATVRGKRFRHVRHAVALDEHRRPFRVRLYEEGDTLDIAATSQSLRQRWFAGAHCDVGGSYRPADAGLADEALAWMVDELRQTAPELGTPALAPRHHRRLQHDALYDTPWWALAGMVLRRTERGRPLRPGAPGHQPTRAPDLAAPNATVWTQRRGLPGLVLAAALALALFWLSARPLREAGFAGAGPGPCLAWLARQMPAQTSGGWPDWLGAPGAFALAQLKSLWGQGLVALQASDLPMPLGPLARGLWWDTLFIPAYGYLVARIASRGFAWQLRHLQPGDARPWWLRLHLGQAPLLLVGADLLENLLSAGGLAAAVWSAYATMACLATGLFWLAGLAALAKLLGLAGCAYWLLVRLRLGWRGWT